MINALFDELDQTLEGKDSVGFIESPTQPHSFDSDNKKVDGEFTESWRDHSAYFPFTDEPEFYVELDPFEEEQAYYQPSKRASFWTRHLDKIIFFSSCSLFMSSLLLLEKDYDFSFASLKEMQTVMANSTSEPANSESTNPDFINYMERALLEIDREEELAQKVKAQAPLSEQLKPIAPITPQGTSRPSPTKSVAPKTTSPKQISALPALPPPPPPLQKATPPAPNPSSAPTAQPNSSDNNSQPTNNTVPSPQPSASQEESVAAVNSQPNPAAVTPEQSGHKLVGLLELGEHSAALLKVQGATQRIMLEESIPGSNWKLVSVANQKATFTNNQQQKVMFVGEEISIK
jgi:hypothetical protein